jgi:hypothetical protein
MNLIVHQVHAKGLGANYIYEDSLEFLEDSINLSNDLLTDFVDEFTNSYYSKILFENKEIRVVETTIPSQNPPVIEDEESLLKDIHDRDIENIGCKTFRRLEFISSPLLAQTEIQMIEDESLVLPFSPSSSSSSSISNSIKIVDHSNLLMPVHRVISFAIKSFFCRNINNNNRICIIGAGGCALPMHLLKTIETKNRIIIDAVESNSLVLNIAMNYFSATFTDIEEFLTNHNILVSNLMDGTTFLLSTHNSYEILVVDAFEDCEIDNNDKDNDKDNKNKDNNDKDNNNNDNNNINKDNKDNNKRGSMSRAPPMSILSEIDIYISSLNEDGGMLVMNLLGDMCWIEEVV